MYRLLVTGFFLIPDMIFWIISEKITLLRFLIHYSRQKWVAISEELDSKNGKVFTI